MINYPYHNRKFMYIYHCVTLNDCLVGFSGQISQLMIVLFDIALHNNIQTYWNILFHSNLCMFTAKLQTCKYHIEIYVIYLNYFEKSLPYLKSYLYIPAQIIYTILHRIIALFVHSFKQNNVQKQHQSFLYTKKTDLILWASTCPCIDSHITSKTVFAMSYTIEAYQ